MKHAEVWFRRDDGIVSIDQWIGRKWQPIRVSRNLHENEHAELRRYLWQIPFGYDRRQDTFAYCLPLWWLFNTVRFALASLFFVCFWRLYRPFWKMLVKLGVAEWPENCRPSLKLR